MTKKQLTIVCAISWMLVGIYILVPEIAFQRHKEECVEFTGSIVDTYITGGNNRVSPKKYYVVVEYNNADGTINTLRGISKAVNENIGDSITFYLDENHNSYRSGVLTDNAFFFIRVELILTVAMVIMYFYTKKEK